MGLEKAKSLLKIRGSETFLDFIAKQVLYMRKAYGVPLAFMLMNRSRPPPTLSTRYAATAASRRATSTSSSSRTRRQR